MNEANENINLIKLNIWLLWLLFTALHELSLQTIIYLMLKSTYTVVESTVMKDLFLCVLFSTRDYEHFIARTGVVFSPT